MRSPRPEPPVALQHRTGPGPLGDRADDAMVDAERGPGRSRGLLGTDVDDHVRDLLRRRRPPEQRGGAMGGDELAGSLSRIRGLTTGYAVGKHLLDALRAGSGQAGRR